jgi:hypothetical protein
MPTVAVSRFVRRQTPESRFGHFAGPWSRVVDLVIENFDRARQGYRDGVILVPVPPEGFFTSVVTLRDGDHLAGTYEPRMPGEEPRKSTVVVGRGKSPAVGCEIVLYRADVLAENDERSADAEWEIISVNANPVEGPVPMDPGTLMANHFQISGGTATNMDDAAFVATLRESFLWWRDKAYVYGGRDGQARHGRGEWVDVPVDLPMRDPSVSISLRLPYQMLAILKEYQTMLKQWLHERIIVEARKFKASLARKDG